jgi:predicted TIM-barrel enzyme
MKFVLLRGEEPPAEVAVVVRGGMNGLDPTTVARTATRSLDAMGFLGVSVFLALDQTVGELCASLDELARYRQVRMSTVGAVRAAGFALLATGDRPHFDIVLPDLYAATLVRLDSVFAPPEPNPGRRP